AGGIAHILNTLLNVIVGHAVLAGSRLSAGHPAHHDIERVLESSSAASTLVHQLLALGGRQRLSPELFDVNTMLSHMEGHLQKLVGEKVELRVDLCTEPLWVNADMAQIQAAVMNLALNGREAMPDGGVLTIKTAKADIDKDDGQRRRIAAGTYA